jgi:RimJ/RimL family protein N-acetyltransferase
MFESCRAHPAMELRPLAAHALVLVARWGFDELDVQRITLLADPRNVASARVAERAGFQREGVLRSWTEVNGERVDHVAFSLLPTDSLGFE